MHRVGKMGMNFYRSGLVRAAVLGLLSALLIGCSSNLTRGRAESLTRERFKFPVNVARAFTLYEDVPCGLGSNLWASDNALVRSTTCRRNTRLCRAMVC
jgi:hypothetical protein